MKQQEIKSKISEFLFWDIAALLNHYQLPQIIEFYSQKYSNHNLWQVEKSLCYF